MFFLSTYLTETGSLFADKNDKNDRKTKNNTIVSSSHNLLFNSIINLLHELLFLQWEFFLKGSREPFPVIKPRFKLKYPTDHIFWQGLLGFFFRATALEH